MCALTNLDSEEGERAENRKVNRRQIYKTQV
jgi:hypothetical protein